jgi:hypothetical protein
MKKYIRKNSKKMNLYKLLIPLISIPIFTNFGTNAFNSVNSQNSIFHGNSLSSLSDYPEGGHQFPESEKNHLIFRYTDT